MSDRRRLSDKVVSTLTCPPGKREQLYFDGVLPGFGVRATPTDRQFIFQYRLGTRVRRMTIGVWGGGDGYTVAAARGEAERLRGRARDGQDPLVERRQRRVRTIQAAATESATRGLTLGSLHAQWAIAMCPQRRPRYLGDVQARLDCYLADWLTMPITAIAKTDVVRRIDTIAGDHGVISARRTLAYARAICGWAVKRDMLAVNPFAAVAMPGQETERERALDGGEIQAIWHASARMRNPLHRDYLRLLLLSLQRREEVAGMRWTELSSDLTCWTVPSERAKNGRAHLVDLPAAAVAILRNIPRVGDWVFPGRSEGRSLAAFSYLKGELDGLLAADRIAAAVAPLAPWTMHDFRRSGVTRLAALGISETVADRLLNHLTGKLRGVARIYQRHDFRAERAHALKVWAEFVTAGDVPAGRRSTQRLVRLGALL